MKVLLKELNGDFPKKEEELEIELTNDTLMINIPGKEYDDLIVAVEIWEGELRALTWPSTEDEDAEPIVTEIRNLP